MKRKNQGLPFLSSLVRDSKGFSLAEVMVAAGMLGVLSLGVSQLMQNSSKTEKRLGQQVNLVTIQGEISDALQNQIGCTRTLSGTATGATTAQAATITNSWTDIPEPVDSAEIIFRGNREDLQFAQNSQWGVALRQYDGSSYTDGSGNTRYYGVYGDGSNTVTVRNIEFRGFYLNSAGTSQFNDDSNYNMTNRDDIPGTSPVEHSGEVVFRVTFTRGNFNQFEGMSDDQRRDSNARRNFGAFEIARFFRVRVRTDDSFNVQRCITREDDQIAAYCQALGGFLDDSDGRCKNIKITEVDDSVGAPKGEALGQDNDWSITVEGFNDGGGNFQGGNLLAEKSLAVGYNRTGVNFGGQNPENQADPLILDPKTMTRGDIRAANDVISDNNLRARNDLLVEDVAYFGSFAYPRLEDGDVNIGGDLEVRSGVAIRSAPVPEPAIPPATLPDGTLVVERNITAGSRDADPSVSLKVTNHAYFDNDYTGNDSIVRINQLTNDTLTVTGTNASSLFSRGTNSIALNPQSTRILEVSSGSNAKLRISQSGQIQIDNSIGTTPLIEIGVGTGTYRPIRVRNQAIAATTMTFGAGSDESRELTTKAWVRRMVFGTFHEGNPTLIQDVVNNIQNYAQHNPLNTLIGNVCTNITLQTGANTSACAMVGPNCVCNPSNCSKSDGSAVGTAVCGAITSSDFVVATTYMRAPRIYTTGTTDPGSGNMRAVNIYSTNDMVATRDVNAGRNVNATNNLTAGNNVTAGNGVISQNRVCTEGNAGNYYCYTRFGKWGCTNYGFMIGIAYGVPICGRNGGGGTSAVRY